MPLEFQKYHPQGTHIGPQGTHIGSHGFPKKISAYYVLPFGQQLSLLQINNS